MRPKIRAARGGLGPFWRTESHYTALNLPKPPRTSSNLPNLPNLFLEAQPMTPLDQQYVGRRRAEQGKGVPAQPKGGVVAFRLAPLRPDHEQRRAGPILPAKHGVRMESLHVERGVVEAQVDRPVCVEIGFVRVAPPHRREPPEAPGIRTGPRIHHLLEVTVAGCRDEGLGVPLE